MHARALEEVCPTGTREEWEASELEGRSPGGRRWGRSGVGTPHNSPLGFSFETTCHVAEEMEISALEPSGQMTWVARRTHPAS